MVEIFMAYAHYWNFGSVMDINASLMILIMHNNKIGFSITNIIVNFTCCTFCAYRNTYSSQDPCSELKNYLNKPNKIFITWITEDEKSGLVRHKILF